jgi:hypothetical protein
MSLSPFSKRIGGQEQEKRNPKVAEEETPYRA